MRIATAHPLPLHFGKRFSSSRPNSQLSKIAVGCRLIPCVPGNHQAIEPGIRFHEFIVLLQLDCKKHNSGKNAEIGEYLNRLPEVDLFHLCCGNRLPCLDSSESASAPPNVKAQLRGNLALALLFLFARRVTS